MADDDRQIITFAENIDVAVVEIELNRNGRLRRHEIDDRRGHVLNAERSWCADAQAAAQRCLQRAGLTGCFIDLGENSRASRIEGFASLGERDAAGRSIEKADA